MRVSLEFNDVSYLGERHKSTSRFLCSKTVREYTSVVSKPPAREDLLQQPQDTTVESEI